VAVVVAVVVAPVVVVVVAVLTVPAQPLTVKINKPRLTSPSNIFLEILFFISTSPKILSYCST
jgi:hypothetical protein